METGAMVRAVAAGDDAAVRTLLQADPRQARERGPDGVSALLLARYRGRADLVELLRPAAEPLDLHEAAALGDTARLDALLRSGADVGAPSTDGFTALHLAAFFGGPGPVRTLVQAGADPNAVAAGGMRVTPLHSAAAARDAASVKALLEAGAAVDAAQAGGHTPLMAAARNQDEAGVRALLAAGADPDRPNDEGRTAHDLAGPSVKRLLDRR